MNFYVSTSNAATSSAGPTPAESSLASSQSKDPSVALSEGLLKLNWLNGLADLRRAQRSNQELLAAQLEQLYGKPVMTTGEDMIAVESPITHTTNHFAAPPVAPPDATATLPNWLKIGALVLGLGAAGGAGALLPSLMRPPSGGAVVQPPRDPASERAYALDFWDPTEVAPPRS